MRLIPDLHFIKASDKLKKPNLKASKVTEATFVERCVDTFYKKTDNRHLLDGKNVKEIEGYYSGSFSMAPFKRMFKSLKKAIDNARTDEDKSVKAADITGLDWTPLPLLPMKMNSAVNNIHKIPVEIDAEALDPLAAKKKEEDIKFLKNKPMLEADLQPLADQMGIGKVDLGETKHSAVNYSNSPYGLDLNDPEELEVFVNLLYSLGVEAAFETALNQFWNIKNGNQIKLLEIIDQFKFGVSCHKTFDSRMTGLPDAKYIYPGDLYVPKSRLPDYSDNTHRIEKYMITPLEFFDFFSNEIGDRDDLERLLNDDENEGYCSCNGRSHINADDWGREKISLIYMEVRSVDSVGIVDRKKGKRNVSYFVEEHEDKDGNVIDDRDRDGNKVTRRLWAQNTYCFWWLENTRHFFGIDKLGFAHREKGSESFQNFSSSICRSQEKSATELCIGENKNAMIAAIKLQHCLIKSLPAGKYIDLAFVRGALSGLNQEGGQDWTMDRLIQMIFEHNQVLGDSQGMEGVNNANYRPVMDLPGGVKAELDGYYRVIQEANAAVSRITGINDQLTGQSANPEGLVGMQKLLVNSSSISALYHVNDAISAQYQRLFTSWSYSIKKAIEQGGKPKETIINMVGAKKVNLIDRLDEVKLHEIGIKIKIKQREEERQDFYNELERMKHSGIITTADVYMLKSIENPSDAFALLAVKEKQWLKRQEQQRKEEQEHQQAMIAAQGQNMQQTQALKDEGKIKQIYADGDVKTKILQLAHQLGLSSMQAEAMVKKILQQDRSKGQTDKQVAAMREKYNLEQRRVLEQ